MAVLGYEVSTWTEGLLVGHAVTWVAAAYCFWSVRKRAQGVPRLIACTPVFVTYIYLPFIFNRNTHLLGIAAYFCIVTWLSTFKILLLCWNTGPGYDPWVATTFPRFAIAMTYPVHMKRTGKVVKRAPLQSSSWIVHLTKSEVWYVLLLRSTLKIIAMGVILKLLLERDSFPLIFVHLLFSIQLYLFVTIVLEILAAIANTLFGITIEPHFDNPFAAVSLEEFWARRWNLLISNCLRETVFNPVLYLVRNPKTDETNERSRPVAGIPSPGFDVSKLIAMLAVFLVSGLAHELAVYYTTLRVTWEMTSFFVVQGIAVACEAAWKLYFPDIRLPRLVGKFSTLGFVFITAHWLFWPPLDPVFDQVLLEVKRLFGFVLG